MDDVLERADKWLADESKEHIPFLITDLAAEVRELRKDRERLRGDLHRVVEMAFERGREFPNGTTLPHLIVLTDLVDAAMDREGRGDED